MRRRGISTAAAVIIGLIGVVLWAGCEQYPPGAGPAQASGAPRSASRSQRGYATQPVAAAQAYRPLYPPRRNWKDFAPGTITYDFNYAATSPTLQIAEERWQSYLTHHRQIEDGFSKHFYVAARFELMRVYYLQGRADKADAILRGFDLSTAELK